ncbi:hypothetical protein Fmac_025315 [Flemingia macrophylla]|uniref:Uncharacterized protein n=1 Tax=Flemingia macrophylla TaxID=520843 RepID=A0ABD1LRW8_9FABA
MHRLSCNAVASQPEIDDNVGFHTTITRRTTAAAPPSIANCRAPPTADLTSTQLPHSQGPPPLALPLL